jgi:hypothetical protein
MEFQFSHDECASLWRSSRRERWKLVRGKARQKGAHAPKDQGGWDATSASAKSCQQVLGTKMGREPWYECELHLLGWQSWWELVSSQPDRQPDGTDLSNLNSVRASIIQSESSPWMRGRPPAGLVANSGVTTDTRYCWFTRKTTRAKIRLGTWGEILRSHAHESPHFQMIP